MWELFVLNLLHIYLRVSHGLTGPGHSRETSFNMACSYIGFILRAITLVDDHNGQSVLFVTPCVEF